MSLHRGQLPLHPTKVVTPPHGQSLIIILFHFIQKIYCVTLTNSCSYALHASLYLLKLKGMRPRANFSSSPKPRDIKKVSYLSGSRQLRSTVIAEAHDEMKPPVAFP